MARHASAVKAARQSLKRNLRNNQVRSAYRTAIKKMRAAIVDKATTEEQLLGMFNKVQSILMKASKRAIIKKGNVSRKISRIATAIHKRKESLQSVSA